MTKAARTIRSTGKRLPSAVTLRGSVAGARSLVIGDNDPNIGTQKVAYLTLDTKGGADIEILSTNCDGEDANWIARADGTILIPVGLAPVELDLTSLRRHLRNTASLGKFLTAIKHGRRLVNDGKTSTPFVYTAEALVACANAATYLLCNLDDGELHTGRSVEFASDVLEKDDMLVVPSVITDIALRTLARSTEAYYASKGRRLLGVLPWLQAQAAK